MTMGNIVAFTGFGNIELVNNYRKEMEFSARNLLSLSFSIYRLAKIVT